MEAVQSTAGTSTFPTLLCSGLWCQIFIDYDNLPPLILRRWLLFHKSFDAGTLVLTSRQHPHAPALHAYQPEELIESALPDHTFGELDGHWRLCRNLQAVYRINASSLVGKNKVGPPGRHGTGSTDMGDISHIMPAIHPYTAGASGISHGNDYIIEDYRLAVLNPAKIMAMTVIDLLADNAVKGKEILTKHKTIMTKQEYLDLMESLRREEEFQG